MRVVIFTFHHQLMHPSIKTLSQFTFKTTQVMKLLYSFACLAFTIFILSPVHVVIFTFHHQLMHPSTKTLSQFTFKTTQVMKLLYSFACLAFTIFILSPCMLLYSLFITDSCTHQLKHFHSLHLKLHTLCSFKCKL